MSITIQNVVTLAQTHVELIVLTGVGGNSNEPALSLANDTISELLASPNKWKFNRAEMNVFVTQPGRQTFQFAGASAWTSWGGVGIGLASANAITESGFTVTVNTLDPHNFSVGDTVYMTGNTVSAYNSTFSQTTSGSAWSGGWTIVSVPSTTSFTFTHATGSLGASGAAGITDCSHLESATMVDMVDTSYPQQISDVTCVRTVKPSSGTGKPTKVALVQDLGTGVLRLRIKDIPTATPFGITIVYQMKAPTKTKLTPSGSENDGTWYPFPDEASFMYRQHFLARAYRYYNSPRSEVEMQKAEAMLAKEQSQDDNETSDETIAPAEPLMGW